MVDEKSGAMERIRLMNFSKVYATNAFVYKTDHDVRIELANEKLKGNTDDFEWTLVVDSMVILSPIGAKRLLANLKKVLDEEGKE